MTSCLENQKQEMKFLKDLFSSGDKLFRITSASLDEMDCLFVVNQEQMFRFHADFPSSYPLDPPIWFSENEVMQSVLGMISSTQGVENRIVNQVKSLIEILCFQFSLSIPEAEMTQLKSYFNDRQIENAHTSNSSSSKQQTPEQVIVLESSSDEEAELDPEIKKARDFIKKAHMIKLKLESEAKSDPKVRKETSTDATRRIMNEVKALTRSDAVKNELIEFDLVKESLYEWEVKLMAKAFDKDSDFYKDLIKLEKKFVLLSVEFNAKFPFDPPFIRVVEPVILNGHIERGGALCMEVVMHRGWIPVMALEALFLQIAATIVRGKGRINFKVSKSMYNRQEAQKAFKWLEQIYDPKTTGGKRWGLDRTG